MLELRAGVPSGGDVGDLLHLQCAFQGDREIRLSAHEEKVPSRGVFRRNAGDDLFTLKCAGYKPGELIKPLDDFHSIGQR